MRPECALALAPVALLLLSASCAVTGQSHPQAPSPGSDGKMVHGIPLFFEQNRGQADGDVRFLARGQDGALLVTERETRLVLPPRAISPRSSAPSSRRNAVVR